MTTFVVAAALLATVVLLRQILLADIDERADRELVQEAEEFSETVRTATRVDDETAEEFARRALTDYLATNVPSENELFLAAQSGRAFIESLDPPGDLRGEVSRYTDLTEPVMETLDTDDGAARVLAQPILREGQQVGLLLIAEFVEPERRAAEQTIRNAALLALASLVAAIALAWIVAGRILRPVRVLADTARDITEHDLSRRIPTQGSDEMEAMVESFNSMLDRLEHTVDTQRRFLDDAGHELRTPLTIVRGHLDVRSLDGSDSAEVDAVVSREIDRMSRIVDDLLVLARAESFEFLDIGPTDTDELVSGMMTLLPPLGDHDWHLEELPFGVVEADADRLTQAVLNLAANAARHTPAGNRIAIGGRLDDDWFSLWVRDTGDGIADEERDRVFERFHRATTERSQGGGAGLGLSIVSAIAHAHGGDVTLDTEVGVGSTFTITIPAHPDSPQKEDRWPES
ncbi:MAG: sensor histidine kinase [Ilumatobacter sp.]